MNCLILLILGACLAAQVAYCAEKNREKRFLLPLLAGPLIAGKVLKDIAEYHHQSYDNTPSCSKPSYPQQPTYPSQPQQPVYYPPPQYYYPSPQQYQSPPIVAPAPAPTCQKPHPPPQPKPCDKTY